jgi:cell division protein FtsI (penicillin-binding protein 3)
MVSLPDYQPENYGNAESEQQFNKAVQGIYEMGSTFKVFTAALAMHEGIADENTLFDATDPLKIDRFTINDFHGKKRPLFVSEVLQYSSNIGSARMALDVGGEKQKNFLKQLGLLDQSPIEIKEQSHPLSPSVWRKTSTATISYGHGISVSPVHLSTAISAMVNGGIMVQPTLLKRSTPIIKKRVISEKVSENIRAMMRLVATAGSARKANVKGYHVGGKTGSAEKIRNGRYVDGLLRTTFVSAFPMDAPKYTVVTLLDEPQGTKATYGFNTSGWNAAPTAGAIIQTIGPMLGVPPRDYVTPIELKMNALPTIENSEPLIQEARHAAR